MHRSSFALLLLVVCACSGGEPSEDATADGAVDASSDAAKDASLDAGDAATDAPSCVCTGVSTCCDGCMPRNANADCADALVCTSSACNILGVCVSTGVPVMCTPPAEPECQMRSCAEPSGCATANIREGMSCSDDNAQTYNDHCASGACVGTACECSSGACCDGCHFRAATFKCIDNGPVSATCSGMDVYGGLCSGLHRVTHQLGDRWCTGASSTCSGTIVTNPSTVSYPCEPDGMNMAHPTVCRTDASDPLGARCAMWCG